MNKTPESEAQSQLPDNNNFIYNVIKADLQSGKHQATVTRFPPEPNGFLHIGHAKSICLNFGVARDFKGRCHLRFDDTNPSTEETQFIDAIKQSVHWLGFDWGEHLFFTSDYFEKIYQYAIQLIEQNDAYVCELSDEEFRQFRGTITEPGKHSPSRQRSVEENLSLFQRMRAGEFKDGACALRAKIDMGNANMKMRDPVIYRIKHASHPRTDTRWCIYPMYDLAHCLSDAIENITHSLCTLEFENNRELYDWFLEKLDMSPRPQQIEFARLNLSHTLMSKRLLRQLVEEKIVDGWDDPRLPTLDGMRRRGYQPAAIRKFCDLIGIAKADNTVEMQQLEHCVRDELNHTAARRMCVLDPVTVVISNWPEDHSEVFEAASFPHDGSQQGSRKVSMSRRLYIERSDFMENPPKRFHRLQPGGLVRLRNGYVICCDKVIKDDTGKVIELHCSYDPETLGKNPQGKKVKGTIHWVDAQTAIEAEIRLYECLFRDAKPDFGQADNGVVDIINTNSLTVQKAWVEASLAAAAPESTFQFERVGYFCADRLLHQPAKKHLVFNQTVALRDSWEKQQDKSPKNRAPKTRAASPQKKQAIKVIEPHIAERAAALVQKWSIEAHLAETIAADADITEFFINSAALAENHAVLANWVVNELLRVTKEQPLTELRFGPEHMAELVNLVSSGKIAASTAKKVFNDMVASGISPTKIVADKYGEKISDATILMGFIEKVLVEHADVVAQYHAGKTNRMGFLIGQAMKQSKGQADAQKLQKMMLKRLQES